MIALVVKTTRVITSVYGTKGLITLTCNRRQHQRLLAVREITAALHLSHF